MENDCTTPIRIAMQGRPLLAQTHGYLVRGNHEVVTFYVDLESRYCRVSGSGGNTDDEGPMIFITETEHSSNLGPAIDPECDTVIQFTEFPGWQIHAAEISKDVLAVALTRSMF